MLRKPEFQRATNGWDDEKILNLLRTLRNNQVIPGVILWLNTETSHIFVLDGAHRLSVIRAWTTSDWGDTEAAKGYGHIGQPELEAARRIRKSVSHQIGDHKACQDAAKKYARWNDSGREPARLAEPELSQGRFMYNLNTSLRIPIQWVTGDYETAERSFININTGGAALSKQEVDFLQYRRSPVARAIIGIVSNSSRPGLWLGKAPECERISKDLYANLLAPSDSTFPERVANYPVCMVKKQRNFDRYLFVHNVVTVSIHGETGEDKLNKSIKEFADDENDALVAGKTLEALVATSELLSNLEGNQSQSLALYPAFYFYTNGGQYKEFLFLLFLAWLAGSNPDERLARKLAFTRCRNVFEDAWMIGKDAIFKAFGRRGAGPARLTKRHAAAIQELISDVTDVKLRRGDPKEAVVKFLERDGRVPAEFRRDLKPHKGKAGARFSAQAKTYSEFLTLFDDAHRCEICGGRVLFGAHQVDHVLERSRGGTNSPENAAFVHPFCNNHKDKLRGVFQPSARQSRSAAASRLSATVTLPAPQPDEDAAKQLTFLF